MAEKLTREQRLAVENRGGKLLVSAAAGSGKTKVLVDRLMGYILDPADPANIDDFLIITYTKAAAAELRGKIAAKLSELIADNAANRHLQQQMQRLYLAKISTVHGFCTDLLRQYAYRLDVNADFSVADESECLQLQLRALEQVLNDAYETAQSNPDFCAFVDSQGLGRDDRQIPEIILKVFNSARCHLNPEQWLRWCAGSGAEGASDAAQTLWGQYLLEDLRHYVAMQMDALQRCVTAGVEFAGMEKPVELFLDTIEQLRVLQESKSWDGAIAAGDIDFGRLIFPKNCADLQLAQQMKAVRNSCKTGLAKRLRSFADDSQRVLADMSQTSAAARGLVQLVDAFTDSYNTLKRNRGVLDFGDLEHKTLDLLLGKQRSGITAIATEVGQRFREIMVDEYQDSNEIQDAIFSALTEKRQNCFMVGDVKQSIYQFRLANPEIFIEKYNTFVNAESANAGEGRRVLLSHNFRSSGGVISAVNDVFGECMSPEVGGLHYGEAEMLREGIDHISLNETEVSLYGIDVEHDTYEEEAAFVAEEITRLLDGTHCVRSGDTLRPIVPEDIVILLRSPGSVGGAFRYALQERGIRCTTGDSADLLQAEEIATLRAILQVVDNPVQDIPLTAVLTSPVFGFTAEDLAILRSKDRYTSIYALVSTAQDDKSKCFTQILNKLRTVARLSTLTQLLSVVYTETNLLSIYAAMPDGDVRLENLQSFFKVVSDYETNGIGELGRLLEFLNAADARGLPTGTNRQDRGAVTIMSIHKSKGLEFPVVFLCGLSRGFNQERARAQVICHRDLGLGLGCVDAKLRVRYPTLAKRAIALKIMQESISEEIRVLYVAMTRARDRLIMTYAVKNLAASIEDITMRLDMSSSELLASEADCPGAWVLQTALKRTEAGAFFALGGNPASCNISETPWKIAVVSGSGYTGVPGSEDAAQTHICKEQLAVLSKGLQFVYPNRGATQIPSKLTATQLKGRTLDNEVAEGAEEKREVTFRKPGINVISGKSYGNAIHSAMQYVQFSACSDIDAIRRDLDRMVREQLIAPEQAELVDCEKLLAFFRTPLGEKLQREKQVLREFKFSLLCDASKFYPDAEGERVLMQGVVDCAIVEDDGIIVIDFKTDYVTEETLPAVAQRYTAQVSTYAEALERIYKKPVKSAVLYFFAMNRFVEVK